MRSAVLAPLLATAALALPAPQTTYPSACPDTFAVSLGPSQTDGREAFFWLDNTDWIRAISSLDIDTPERATFRITNNLLYPANNPDIYAQVPEDGGVIEFHPSSDPNGNPITATVTQDSTGKCHVSFTSGSNTYISMQNYKGWMHLTSDPAYSSRQWGAGPFELLPFPSAPALAVRQTRPLDTSLCPLSSFAISTGPSVTDNRTGYPWLDLANSIRANTGLDISTPERSAFALVNGNLHPAVVNTSYIGFVPADGGTIRFAAPDAQGGKAGYLPISAAVERVEAKEGGGVKCFVSMRAGAEGQYKFWSMQNYKGYMHLTDDPAYSSRYWGEGPWEMLPFAAPWEVPAGLPEQ
ncbi:Hypothetical protein D9617_11g009940 [Elsinoe fawcettii]|nr:Hypothetical protein D9617_11g009940 [Elsinoe fawcettii]